LLESEFEQWDTVTTNERSANLQVLLIREYTWQTPAGKNGHLPSAVPTGGTHAASHKLNFRTHRFTQTQTYTHTNTYNYTLRHT